MAKVRSGVSDDAKDLPITHSFLMESRQMCSLFWMRDEVLGGNANALLGRFVALSDVFCGNLGRIGRSRAIDRTEKFVLTLVEGTLGCQRHQRSAPVLTKQLCWHELTVKLSI